MTIAVKKPFFFSVVISLLSLVYLQNPVYAYSGAQANKDGSFIVYEPERHPDNYHNIIGLKIIKSDHNGQKKISISKGWPESIYRLTDNISIAKFYKNAENPDKEYEIYNNGILSESKNVQLHSYSISKESGKYLISEKDSSGKVKLNLYDKNDKKTNEWYSDELNPDFDDYLKYRLSHDGLFIYQQPKWGESSTIINAFNISDLPEKELYVYSADSADKPFAHFKFINTNSFFTVLKNNVIILKNNESIWTDSRFIGSWPFDKLEVSKNKKWYLAWNNRDNYFQLWNQEGKVIFDSVKHPLTMDFVKSKYNQEKFNKKFGQFELLEASLYENKLVFRHRLKGSSKYVYYIFDPENVEIAPKKYILNYYNLRQGSFELYNLFNKKHVTMSGNNQPESFKTIDLVPVK